MEQTQNIDVRQMHFEGKVASKNGYIFKENTDSGILDKIVIAGLFLPKDKVSRNNVLYEWSSVEKLYKKLIGLPTLYNHLNEGREKPVGHFTDSVLLYERPEDSSKWQKVWDKTEKEYGKEISGWYYESDINPKSEYADSVVRGDVRKVSIQAMSNKAVEESDDNGNKFTRAWLSDILEGSLVPTPGFMETSMEVLIAESFNKKEFSLDEDFPMKQFHDMLRVFSKTVPDMFQAARMAIDELESLGNEALKEIESLTKEEEKSLMGKIEGIN